MQIESGCYCNRRCASKTVPRTWSCLSAEKYAQKFPTKRTVQELLGGVDRAGVDENIRGAVSDQRDRAVHLVRIAACAQHASGVQ